MDLCDAMRMMVGSSGMSHREIADCLGKSRSYVSVMANAACSGGDIGVRKLVAMADACGYDLVMVRRSDGLVVKLS